MKEFLKLDNKLILKLKIKPISPLCIKLGTDKNAKKADATSYLLTTESYPELKIETGLERKGEIYIPGSTLKGMFRDRFIEMSETEEEIEKLFGFSKDDGSSFKGRIFLQDAYFTDENKRKEFYNDEEGLKKFIRKRAITPIDHFSGKVDVPLQFEYTKENFTTEIIVNNILEDEFQKIYFILRDSILGEIRIGNSKTRGFGQIAFEIEELRFDNYIGKNEFFNNLKEYFILDEKKSLKIGNSYLYETMYLKDEYKKINLEKPNKFILALFREVK